MENNTIHVDELGSFNLYKFVTCRRDEEQLYHKMNLTELHQNASFLDWTRYFNSAFESVGRKIDSGLEVVNYAPVYLRDEHLLKLMKFSWRNRHLNGYSATQHL